MTISQTLNGKDLTIALGGYLDTTTSPELKALLDRTMDSIETLTFDFKDLEYISSAGLRVLLTAHMAMSGKGGMKILNANEEIIESMTVTGLADMLTIEKA